MATKVTTKSKSNVSTKAKAEENQSENAELIAAEVPKALVLLKGWKTSEEVTQSKFIGLVKHFRDWSEENEASSKELTAVLRQAYAEYWNERNPKAKIKAEDLAGKDGLTNYGQLVTEMSKIKRWVFPAEKAVKVFAKAFNERSEGKANYTIASLDNCAKTGEKPTEAAKRGRKSGSTVKPKADKKTKDKISDVEVLKTEIAVVMAKYDTDGLDEDEIDEIGEAVEEQVAEWVAKAKEQLED